MPTDDGDEPTDGVASVSRRRMLELSGVGLVGGLAGCSSGGSSGGPTTTAEPTETSESPSETTTTGAEASFDASVLANSPSSDIAPADGFADVSWLADAELNVVKVTNLDASGEGSLRWALDQTGATLVVFEVGGVIDLEREHLRPTQSQTFVAGQTAPSPGITLIRGSLDIAADDFIVQHLRVRPGDDFEGQLGLDGINNDAGSNVIVDHCSVTWATDENLSVAAEEGDENTTYTNNLVAECLADSIHPKGVHPYGTLVNDNNKRVALAGNLWANNLARVPRLKGGTTTAVAGNVMYNFKRGTNLGGGTDAETLATIVSNYYRAGPDTDTSDPCIGTTFTGAQGNIRAYIAANTTDPQSMSILKAGTQLTRVTTRPVWPEDLAVGAGNTYDAVLSATGARPADRTHHDERVLTDVRERTGGYIDSQEEVGGYPDLDATQRTLDVPETGRAEWLAAFTAEVEAGAQASSN